MGWLTGSGNIFDKTASAATGGAIGGKQGSRDIWGTAINQETPLGQLASPAAKLAALALTAGAAGYGPAAGLMSSGTGTGVAAGSGGGMAALPGSSPVMANTAGIAGAGNVASAQAAGLGLGGAGAGSGVGAGAGLTAGQLGLGLGGIGATLYGVNQQRSAADKAAAISEAGTRSSNELQAEMFRQSQENMKPWLEAGGRALTRQEAMLNDPSSYQQDPYNAWLQQQGEQAINRSAAAKGMLGSGNVLTELARYGQGMAGQGYADQYNRWAGLSGTGQTQANQMAGQAGQYASNVGNLNMQNASNQANLGMARDGANNQLVQGLLGNAASMYGMYNQNQQNNMLMYGMYNQNQQNNMLMNLLNKPSGV